MQTFTFTCGDINGIGPEICLKTFNKILPKKSYRVVLFCPANVFIDTCQIVNPGFEFVITKSWSDVKKSEFPLTVFDIGKANVTVGKPTKTSGKFSFKSIKLAHKSITDGISSAMITAPISKTSFKLAGIKYPGHTELLADLSKTKKFVMTFLSEAFITALVSIHVPVKNVSSKITQKSILDTIEVVQNSLKKDFNIAEPKLSILGLNPHAGEEGQIGIEEIKTIQPAIKKVKSKNIYGPFSADAYFGNKLYKNYDATIGMYHDQVLIPFKMINFEDGVNYTAGLPIVRTSPDHGTAFDIAGQNRASSSSMFSAFRWAQKIVKNRNANTG
jgi:4-hydroxythreonine-4-phosphate dehydrogenase